MSLHPAHLRQGLGCTSTTISGCCHGVFPPFALIRNTWKLLTLLRELRGHLRGLDLSQISIRGASLQEVEMQDAMLSEAILRDTTFTEALDATRAVAISRDGRYWATGSWRGKVRVW